MERQSYTYRWFRRNMGKLERRDARQPYDSLTGMQRRIKRHTVMAISDYMVIAGTLRPMMRNADNWGY